MEKMLLFMKKYPVLVHGKASGTVDRSLNQHLWQTLSNILNSDGSGPAKPALKWQKTWIDWKSNTKKKYMRIKNHIKESNEGTSCPFPLSKIEEKLIEFLYPESFEEDVLLTEAGQQSNDNEIQEIHYEIKKGIPETFAIEDVDVEVEVEEDDNVNVHPMKRQKVYKDNFVDIQFQGGEKSIDCAERKLELEERKILLKERAVRDKERRTDIFDKAIRDKERRTEIYDRAVRDRERKTDIYDRSVRDKARKIELLSRIVRDMERRTEILNRASTAMIKTMVTYSESLSNNK